MAAVKDQVMERQTADSQQGRMLYGKDMERQTAASQNTRLTYGQDETFDIEIGMDVYGADGQKIGTVTEVAGFGSTQVQETSHPEAAESVTQARSATGYIIVDGVLGTNGNRLTVPFHGIATVTAEQGVVLNDTVISKLRAQAERTASIGDAAPPPQRGRWHRWVSNRRQ